MKKDFITTAIQSYTDYINGHRSYAGLGTSGGVMDTKEIFERSTDEYLQLISNKVEVFNALNLKDYINEELLFPAYTKNDNIANLKIDENGVISVGFSNGQELVYSEVGREEFPYLVSMLEVFRNIDIKQLCYFEFIDNFRYFFELPNEFYGVSDSVENSKTATRVFSKYFPQFFKASYLSAVKDFSEDKVESFNQSVNEFVGQFPKAFKLVQIGVRSFRELKSINIDSESDSNIELTQLLDNIDNLQQLI